jgi:NADH dehydrogenase
MATFVARGLRTATTSIKFSRLLSTEPLPPPPPPRFRRLRSAAKWTGLLFASTVVGVVGLGTAIFVHDAFTYHDRHVDRVPVSPLALHPKRGGPKNLPVVHVLVGDEEDEENRRLEEKPKLVIVGGGWGVGLASAHDSPN